MINDAARPSRCLPSLPTAILSAIVPAGAASATSESGSDCRRNSVQRTTRAAMDGSYFAKRGADRFGADGPGADQPGAASPHDRNHSLFDQTAQGFYSVRRTFRARFAGLCRGGNRLAQDGELKTAARASAANACGCASQILVVILAPARIQRMALRSATVSPGIQSGSSRERNRLISSSHGGSFGGHAQGA